MFWKLYSPSKVYVQLGRPTIFLCIGTVENNLCDLKYDGWTPNVVGLCCPRLVHSRPRRVPVRAAQQLEHHSTSS
jgi:hypothetical protein